ncbi:hypothetical protein [Nocardia sp. IFM 10818]
MTDVAFLSTVSTSTLSRLWQDEQWLDAVSGATLQRLITAVPGLAGYVERRSHSARVEAALRRCAESGLEVRHDRLADLIRTGQPVQYVATVLEAAAGVMRLDARATVASLARCWGSRQSHALDAVFALSPEGLVARPEELADKALQLVDRVETGNALRPTVGYGILVHKLTRLTGQMPAAAAAAADRSSAFAHRSGVIGVLIGGGDVDAAIAYQRELVGNPLLRRNELWSLASFGGDIALTPEIGGATRARLHRTAAEVIGDIVALPEAYLHYLAATAIPVLLDYDSTFGSAAPELQRAVTARLDNGVQDPRTRSALADLIKRM